MGSNMTVFQAEVLAIKTCAEMNTAKGIKNKTINILSDSESALKAISNPIITSKMVLETVSSLKQLSTDGNNIKLQWVPAHCGIIGNEKADEIAKRGATKTFFGPEPFAGISRTTVKNHLKTLLREDHCKYWCLRNGLNHSKKFIAGIDSNRSKYLLSLRKKQIRLICGFLTGHYPLKSRLKLMNISRDSTCRFCDTEDETAEHLLCDCECLARIRMKLFGIGYPEPEDYFSIEDAVLLQFLTKIKV